MGKQEGKSAWRNSDNFKKPGTYQAVAGMPDFLKLFMCGCLCVCVFAHVCVCMCVCVLVRVCVHVCMYVWPSLRLLITSGVM